MDPFPLVVGRHGRRGQATGWCPVPAPLAVYRMTSEQAGGVWPLIAGDGLPPTGAPMGIDYLSGGAFHADPIGWTLARHRRGDQPEHDRLRRPRPRQVRDREDVLPADDGLRLRAPSFLGDVKDEYEPLCRALGVAPHAVGHGLPARINPLDFGPLGNDWTALPRAEAQRRAAMVFARWLLLIKGLVGSQHVPFGPTAETAIAQVIRDLTGYTAGADSMAAITIPQVWHGAQRPHPGAGHRLPLRRPATVPRRNPTRPRRPRLAGQGPPRRPVRRPHQHRRRLARPDPIPIPVPAGPARR